jgi:hypothetical protein
MHRHARQLLAVLLGPALLGACGSGPDHSTRVLQHRLDRRLAAEQAQHDVTVQRLTDGAQLNFAESSLFQPGKSDLSPRGRYVIADFAEALLAPSLMQISVAGSGQTADYLRLQRAQSVLNYVQAYSLSPIPAAATEPIAGPNGSTANGLTIDVRVVCPPGPQGTTWGYPPYQPTCN